MATHHKYQLNSKDQQLFSFGKKFFGKKLDQIRSKKDYVQILREKGLMDYLDRKIINNDINNLSRFSKNNNKNLKIKQLMTTQKSTSHQQKSQSFNEFPTLDSKIGTKTNHFRNLKILNKPGAVNEKNYINNVLIKPKYNQINQKSSTPLQILADFQNIQNRELKSMPMIIQADEYFENLNKNYATWNNIPSANNAHLFDSEFFNQSRSMNEIELENKQMEERMEFLKNYLGKENQILKIKIPVRRGTSFEPKKRTQILL